MDQDKLDELQGEIYDLEKPSQELVDAIETAGGCETAVDFKANLDVALDLLEQLVKDVKDLRKRAGK